MGRTDFVRREFHSLGPATEKRRVEMLHDDTTEQEGLIK